MSKKIKAVELKVGQKISLLGKILTVKEIEISDLGKQGTKKVRLVLSADSGEDQVIIRPSDYPFEVV